MRISGVHVYALELPVVGGAYKMSLGSVSSLDTTVVEITTDQGTVGYGETCPIGPTYQPQHALGARAALQEIGPHLIGKNALNIERIWDAMEQALNGSLYAKAAVDVALWDIAGKTYGTRICDLLGGAVQEVVPSYCAVGIAPPDETVEALKDKQQQGFKRFQVKVGGRLLDEDIAVIRKAAETMRPGDKLAIDANRAWTPRDALAVSIACQSYPFVMEQPCETYEQILSIRRQVRHPIYMDESAEDLGVILRAISDKAVDGFGLKLTRVGGLSTMRTIRDVCRVAGLPITCDDSWGGDIVSAACIHIGATVSPGLLEGVWVAAPYVSDHYDPENGPEIRNGQLTLPGGPGLGIVPRKDVLGDPLFSFG